MSRVHDRELGRDVAIKELLARNSVNEVRFLREVLITARLEHPGIVPVHEAGRWPDGTPFYAMKLVSGRPLRDLIAERSTVEQRIGLLHHVIAVADAIAYAHGRNIVHRDLKPANVIVGDFGETIVIDWGLAKDITTSDEPSVGTSEASGSEDDDLTVTGSVLGTPAYMSPEQRRGEAVDQRADVFAIGTMLWELCAMQKAPPARAHIRHRLLRRAGIDEDLATIINKAVDPDPAHRYRDAGALAADLKAFKSGARIAARSYSLLALLAHWTRRHRALALSIVVALVLVVTVTLLYVRSIQSERDRADASEEVAREQRAAAENSVDEFTLQNAQLLLTADPSAASDAVRKYDGPNVDRARQIEAEARGRGVAVVRALPHTNNVLWAQGSPDGGILSLSLDGTIARTSRDGTTEVLARGVSKRARSSYSPARQLLAYACDPSDVCLFDVQRSSAIPVPALLREANVTGVAFSSSGTLLALLSHESGLRILDTTDLARPELRLTRPISGGVDVVFIGDEVVAVGHPAGVEFVRVTGGSEQFAFPDIARWTSRRGERELALANRSGAAVVIESFPARITAQTTLCRGPLAGLEFLADRREIAYACREGEIGIWDLQRGTVTQRAQVEGHADTVATSSRGDYIVAAGGNGTVTLLDLETDLVASYKGHGFRLTWITAPTPEHPFLISADVRGAVRAWPPPARYARVATTSSSPFHGAIFDNHGTTVVATTWLPALIVASRTGGARSQGPHERSNLYLERSSSGKTFASYGQRDLVEVWSLETMTRLHDITTRHGSISQLSFVGDGEDFITAGHDGRLVRWAPSREQTLLVEFSRPIDRFASSAATGAVVFSSADGALWRTGDDGRAVALRPGGSRVNRLLAVTGQAIVYAGYADGDVVAIDTRTWRQETVLRGQGAVGEIAATVDGRTVAVATNDGTIHVGTQGDGAPGPATMTWMTWAARARYITLAPDGLLVASCTDGTIWLYATALRRWHSLFTGTADLGRTVITADGKSAVVLDFEGRLIWIDLEVVRQRIDVEVQYPQ